MELVARGCQNVTLDSCIDPSDALKVLVILMTYMQLNNNVKSYWQCTYKTQYHMNTERHRQYCQANYHCRVGIKFMNLCLFVCF